MSDLIIWIWLGGSLLIACVGSYVAGKAGDAELLLFLLFVGLIWPVVAVLVLIVLPFAGLFYLGKRDRLAGKVQAYRRAADVARQALGDTE